MHGTDIDQFREDVLLQLSLSHDAVMERPFPIRSETELLAQIATWAGIADCDASSRFDVAIALRDMARILFRASYKIEDGANHG